MIMTYQQILLRLTSIRPAKEILETLEQDDYIIIPIKFNNKQIYPIKFEQNN